MSLSSASLSFAKSPFTFEISTFADLVLSLHALFLTKDFSSLLFHQNFIADFDFFHEFVKELDGFSGFSHVRDVRHNDGEDPDEAIWVYSGNKGVCEMDITRF